MPPKLFNEDINDMMQLSRPSNNWEPKLFVKLNLQIDQNKYNKDYYFLKRKSEPCNAKAKLEQPGFEES